MLTPNLSPAGVGAVEDGGDDTGPVAATQDRASAERRAPRKPIVAFVWYQLITADDQPDAVGWSGIARSCDISKGGLGIVTSHALPVGARAFVEIATADGNVSAVAEIKYCSEAHEGYYRAGMHLDIVPPNDRALLARLLR